MVRKLASLLPCPTSKHLNQPATKTISQLRSQLRKIRVSCRERTTCARRNANQGHPIITITRLMTTHDHCANRPHTNTTLLNRMRTWQEKKIDGGREEKNVGISCQELTHVWLPPSLDPGLRAGTVGGCALVAAGIAKQFHQLWHPFPSHTL